MTKKNAAKARKADWQTALVERRVVAFGDGSRMVSYPTIAARDAAIVAAVSSGFPYRIVEWECCS